jgi:ectoine hydroxylase-related dioxygenase (phytanoyl-CoA dioxygenase family)
MFSKDKYDKNRNDAITSSITVDYLDPSSFCNTVNNINNYGICILKNVLNETECQSLINGMCSDFSYLTQKMTPQFDINNSVTWSTLNSLLPIDGMLYQHWGIGQSQTVWNVRTNDKVIDVFSKIYGTSDLLVSFDAVNFALPPEFTDNKPNKYYSDDKWHFDQSLTRNNFECIQGWVNAFDTNQEDSTLAIMIYSNKFHKLYADYLIGLGQTLNKDDWLRIEDLSFFTHYGCIPYRVEAPKGSLVLWDSRTLHFGSKPLPWRTKPNYRMLIYLCYTPSSLITEAKRKRKIEIFLEKGKFGQGRTTNHWPHKPKVFPETPRLWNNDPPNITSLPNPIIDVKYKGLIGFK